MDSIDCVVMSNIVIGNIVLYGVIVGEVYFEGVVGEWFVVWNFGVIVVVEGVGDYGCEYMMGGVVFVFGEIGWNFVVGMFGGIVYVYDFDGIFKDWCNLLMVDLEFIKLMFGEIGNEFGKF